MSQSRRDFLKWTCAGGVAAQVLAPNDSLGCWYGRDQQAIVMDIKSGPRIWITSPEPGSTLGRTFTAYGGYTLGAYFERGVETITSRLYKGDVSLDAATVTWTTEDPLTWMADFVVPPDMWPDGETDLILEVKMKLLGSANIYSDSSDRLTLLGALQPPPITIDPPRGEGVKEHEIPTNPETKGWLNDTSIRRISSIYAYKGQSLSVAAGHPTATASGVRWFANHSLSGHGGKDKVSLIVNTVGGPIFSPRKFTASVVNIKIKKT
jgi:hypothetical protein